MFANRKDRERSSSGDHADVTNADRGAVFPLSDFHFVGETKRSDFGVAIKRRAHPRRACRCEANRNRIVHPVNVVANIFNNAPNIAGSCVDNGADPDGCHGNSVESS